MRLKDNLFITAVILTLTAGAIGILVVVSVLLPTVAAAMGTLFHAL